AGRPCADAEVPRPGAVRGGGPRPEQPGGASPRPQGRHAEVVEGLLRAAGSVLDHARAGGALRWRSGASAPRSGGVLQPTFRSLFGRFPRNGATTAAERHFAKRSNPGTICATKAARNLGNRFLAFFGRMSYS